ncbi:MAG: DUF4126 family protein [Gemmatimonadota bacterium]
MTAAGWPPELWTLLPLGLAAGLDLYLTLFLLGAAPWLGFDAVLPGALSGLRSPPVLMLAAVFYLLEGAAERWAPSTVFWNAVHIVVRPVTVALLALLLLQEAPTALRVGGTVLTGMVALGTQAVRVGGSFVLWLSRARTATRVIASAAEDATVVALTAFLLERPEAGTVVAAVLILAAFPQAGAYVDAFAFTLRSAWGRTWGVLRPRRWLDREAFPPWVDQVVTRRAEETGPVRGTPAAGFRLPVGAIFRRGWIVVTDSGPAFVHRRALEAHVLPLRALHPVAVTDHGFHRRVRLSDGEGGAAELHVPPDGPSAEALAAGLTGSPDGPASGSSAGRPGGPGAHGPPDRAVRGRDVPGRNRPPGAG